MQEQGRAQLGIGWGGASSPDCRPLTLDEFKRIDFSKIDLEELFADMLKQGRSKMNKSFPSLRPGEVPAIQQEHMKTNAEEKREIRRRAEEEARRKERERLAELERQRLAKLEAERLERERLEAERKRLAEEERRRKLAAQRPVKTEAECAATHRQFVVNAKYQLDQALATGYPPKIQRATSYFNQIKSEYNKRWGSKYGYYY